MSAIERYPEYTQQPEQESMDEAIIQSGIDHILLDGSYRPDVAQYERMRTIQTELAGRGISTVLSTIYQRGRHEPISYMLRRSTEERELAQVVQLDNYR